MNEALQTGLYLTVAGMGLVFLVLAILWGLIVLLLKFDKGTLPTSRAEMTVDSATEGKVHSEVIAAISVALHAYKADKRRRVEDLPNDVTESGIDTWSVTGRAQQQRDWQPRRWN